MNIQGSAWFHNTPGVCSAKHSVMWSCFLPSLRPPGARALLSPGQVVLLVEIDASSSNLSVRAPSTPLGRRSTRTRWVSVPPGIFNEDRSMLFCRHTNLAVKHLITAPCHTNVWNTDIRFSLRRSTAWHFLLFYVLIWFMLFIHFTTLKPKKPN